MRNLDWWDGIVPPLDRTRRAAVERLWTMWKHGTGTMDCEIANIEGLGFEVRFKRDGDLYFSRVFPTRALAVQEAMWKKTDLLGAGWLERLETPN